MSVSDLMTGLMIIFMFITVAYMERVRETHKVLEDYVETKQQLHEELSKNFDQETKMGELTLGNDLSMKFNNASSLFEPGSSDLNDTFKCKLKKFLPKYLNTLLSSKFSDQIMEIRIEGHTDDKPYSLHSDPYIANAILSQRRALSVLMYMRSMPEYLSMDKDKKKKLDFWFTANGFSFGKSLDKDGNFTYVTNNEIDCDKSRRVEFRIITRGEDVLEDFVEKVN
ncbi:MAG: OmpA family protein [Paludibacteraceae bacterium]|nr:OmpA family protein [Paludibacteraceae bacterium]